MVPASRNPKPICIYVAAVKMAHERIRSVAGHLHNEDGAEEDKHRINEVVLLKGAWYSFYHDLPRLRES